MAQPGRATSINLAIKGLYLNPSTFGDNAPPGALSIANNVVIDRPSVVATRRGFNNSFSTLESAGVVSLLQYGDTMLAHATDSKLYKVSNTGVETAFSGTYPVPDPSVESSRIRSVEINKNYYFITGDGTYRLDSVVNQPRLAGCPSGLSGYGVTTGTSGFLANNTRVAYRVVFGFKDNNQQIVLGAPSSRITVTNTAGASANTVVTFQVPAEVAATPTSYFFQLYRGNASASLLTEPDDEMALTYEELCSTNLVGRTITVTDITPNSLLGAALYTNSGQEGILQSNYRPPWAYDITTFKQYAFYANTRTRQDAYLTLISAGASNGVDAMVSGDYVTITMSISGVSHVITLTGVDTANDPLTNKFQISNTGNPAFDIQTTSTNLTYVANVVASNANYFSAYYISTPNELPGKMRFELNSLEPNTFTITVNRNIPWEQVFPIISKNDVKPNRVYYSKFNQPESVPVVNYMDIGSANQPIYRIVPLRDGVMVMKGDGVFRISNASSPFAITPIDYNVRILAENTAAELDNKVYFLSDQGVVALGDSDAQIMSFVLDRTIIQNTSPTLFPNLRATAWGTAYQSDRKYILAMPTSPGDVQATQQYVWNHLTQVWTRWTIPASCATILKLDGSMYLGSKGGTAPGTNNNYIYKERKDFTNADYADNQYSSVCRTSGPTNIITIDKPVLPFGVDLREGWTVEQTSAGTSGGRARIVSTSQINDTQIIVELDNTQLWSVAPIIIYVPIYSEVETIQLDCENPGMNKQFSEMVYIFTEQGFSKLTARVSSNTTSTQHIDYLKPEIRGGWGIDVWGDSPWGGGVSGQGKIRRYVPQKVQRAGWIYINIQNAEAFTSFGWSGMELYFKSTSSRQK